MREVFIHEVGLRDGLQIEKSVASTDVKLRWIEKLAESGVDVIQVGSFVNPDRVPQMADTDLLFRELAHRPRASRPLLSALVLNEKGLHRGLDVGVEFFCMGVSASDTHSRKNTGMSTEEATNRIIAMARLAQQAGAKVQVSVQSAFGCGFEGVVPSDRVIEIVERFIESGLGQISLADTAGHAQPGQVRDLFGAIRDLAPDAELACHFHDTYGLAMANCYAALEAGVRWFESAFGGLGGCPFTALSGGNVSTEDLVHMLQRMRLVPDIRLQPIFDVVAEAEQLVGRTLPGVVHRTGVIPAAAPALVTA